jgi:hypothetical protein
MARHYRHGEKPCRECLDGQNARRRADREAAGATPRGPYGADRTCAPHGTRARYMKHYRDGEKPCDPCRTEYNRLQVLRKTQRRNEVRGAFQ